MSPRRKEANASFDKVKSLESIIQGRSGSIESRGSNASSNGLANRKHNFTLDNQYATLSKSGINQFQRDQLELNILEKQLEQEYKQLETLVSHTNQNNYVVPVL